MSNFIDRICIENFKSIKYCEIQDCKRINLFIGRPNVGKSNILEALSLFTIPYLRENTSKKLSTLIRLENEAELFYNGNTHTDASIKTDIGNCTLGFHPKEGLKAIVDFHGDSWHNIRIDEKLNVTGIGKHKWFEPPVKRYNYKPNVAYKKSHAKYLIPPFGYNLLSIIENYKELKQEVISLFKEYNLDIAFDKASQTIKIIQSNKGEIFLIPYNSIADTLQRIIFYKSAIASNNDSILLFEEPEAHAFPPYMSLMTQQMINKKDNQYFVATHSPFILNDLLENGLEELAVFTVHYELNKTKVTSLDRDELHQIFQNGVDLFTNSESFV
ncbi:MAG: AAA family ATPase [Bacteroidota bacterium]|nr:AAA family ATPase [Bacteroidota bacterium]